MVLDKALDVPVVSHFAMLPAAAVQAIISFMKLCEQS
jgi:hypothetical protein